jgi:hypothetical protein
MRLEDLLQLLFLTGAVILLLGLLWLLVSAFRVSWKWGFLTAFFFPVMAIPHIVRHWPRTKPPLLTVIFGLVLVSLPPAYSRLAPIDLGPHEQMVDGERHVTLTGWDQKDYAVIARRPDIVVLQMANADVTDDTLQYLSSLSNLQELDLSDSQITDAGMKSLTGLKKLQTLRLARTAVTDVGFLELTSALTELKQLDLSATKVTPEAVQKWSEAGPDRMALQ